MSTRSTLEPWSLDREVLKTQGRVALLLLITSSYRFIHFVAYWILKMTSFKFSTQMKGLATKPTFYLLSLLFLAYLRQSLYFIQQHYSERRDIDLTKELVKTLEKLAPNLQSLVQGQGENCKICDPRWLSRLETRLTSSLLGLLMSVFFFYKLVGVRCVSRAKMMSLAVTQLWQTWEWAAKDLGNESEQEIKNGRRRDRVQYEVSSIHGYCFKRGSELKLKHFSS